MLYFKNAPYMKARTSQTIKYSSLIWKLKSQEGKYVQERQTQLSAQKSASLGGPPWLTAHRLPLYGPQSVFYYLYDAFTTCFWVACVYVSVPDHHVGGKPSKGRDPVILFCSFFPQRLEQRPTVRCPVIAYRLCSSMSETSGA